MDSLSKFKQSLFQNFFLLVLLLLIGSGIAIAMLALRVWYTQGITYGFMLWNLFLAWLPLVFGLLTFWLQYRKKPLWITVISGLLWLLFFPNALYVITDFIHIYDLGLYGGAPIWFDVILMAGFSLNSLLLGYTSLYLIETTIRKNSSAWVAYASSAFFLFLSSFGIYLGRFIRWNSWDLITHPMILLYDIVSIALNPLSHTRTIVFTLCFGAVVFVGYAVLRLLMNVHALFAQLSDYEKKKK